MLKLGILLVIIVLTLIVTGSLSLDGLMEFFSFQKAYGGATVITPVSIVFVKEIGGCKEFKITGPSIDSQMALLKEIKVTDLMPVSIIHPPTITPAATVNTNGNTDTFTYNPVAGNPTTPPMATLTVCPAGKPDVYSIELTETAEPNFLTGKLIVSEQAVDTGASESFFFSTNFNVDKVLPKPGCGDITVFSRNIDLSTLSITCSTGPGGSGTTTVSIFAKIINPLNPGIVSVSFDPHGDTFLLVSEVCVVFEDGSFVCPTDIDVGHLIELPTELLVSVAGMPIPIDTTMVLALGAQYTAAWMIPIIVAAIGIGIVIARKF